MYKIALIFSIFATTIFADAFLTAKEYGEMIYHKSKPTACAKCHGLEAEGKLLALYQDKRNNESKIYAPALIGISAEKLQKSLISHGFAPIYYLSKDEIEALSQFLQSLR